MQLSEHFNFSAGVKRLRSASFADVERWVSTFPAVLAAPPTLATTDAICQVFPDTTRIQAEALEAELSDDRSLLSQLEGTMLRKRNHPLVWQEWHPFLYGAIRIMRPMVVFETGVFDGRSSALILAAMSRNNSGELVSIDLPARATIPGATDKMFKGAQTNLPEGCDPGWLVPEHLRDRYRLHLGDSKELLPALLGQYGQIQVFMHDSLHTFEHQSFEYRTAWPHIENHGLLMSDDIFWSAAFHRFSKKKHVPYVNVGDFGIIRVTR
jgi:hypothetical protein